MLPVSASADMIVYPTTTQGEIGDASPENVADWVELVLEMDEVTLAQKEYDGNDTSLTLETYDGGFVVVKAGTEYTIWQDDDRDGIIQIASAQGISSTYAPVPEPSTMLLFGSGLIGLSVFARRKMKRA
jgi:hypothetical protein